MIPSLDIFFYPWFLRLSGIYCDLWLIENFDSDLVFMSLVSYSSLENLETLEYSYISNRAVVMVSLFFGDFDLFLLIQKSSDKK